MIEIVEGSDTWQSILKWAQEREAVALGVLRAPSTDERETQFIRGRLAILRELRELPEGSLDTLDKNPEVVIP